MIRHSIRLSWALSDGNLDFGRSDFGIVLGCKYYIKEITNPKLAEKDPGLREGDSILRINGQPLEGMNLDEASKFCSTHI